MEDISDLLKEGIRAVKAGQRERAKTLLTQVIAADEENERAWLWLSGVVDTKEEQRICLENVLTINPDNALAEKGLARLRPTLEEGLDLPPSSVVSTAPESMPESPNDMPLPPSLEARAAQLTQSEPYEETGWWEDKPIAAPPPSLPGVKFNDVWSGDEEICAFCAEPVRRTDSHCPKCNRPLLVKTLINAVPGPYYHRLLTWITVFVSLRVIGIIFVLLIVFVEGFSAGIDTASLLTESLATFIPLVVAVVGVYKREAWAYWLLFIVSIVETGILALVAFGSGNLGLLICLSPLLLLSAFILFTIYMAGEDFQKVPARRIAAVSDRLKEPRDLDKVAQQLAKEGRWASAVLHWQRAVGRASGHAPYLLRLGHAFAELGFYERSLDILRSALEAARNRDMRQEVEQEMVRVSRLSQPADETQAT